MNAMKAVFEIKGYLHVGEFTLSRHADDPSKAAAWFLEAMDDKPSILVRRWDGIRVGHIDMPQTAYPSLADFCEDEKFSDMAKSLAAQHGLSL